MRSRRVSIIHEERMSDSPYVESITRGRTISSGSSIRPAEVHWHMVFVKVNDRTLPLVVGPLSASGIAAWGEGAEILWIKFKLGTFMPHLPIKTCMDSETMLPEAACKSFWLNSSTWQFPDFENVDTVVCKLVREDVLVCDPVVNVALNDHLPDMSPRTVKHRFVQATGLTQTHIRQMKRAQQAAAFLQQGKSISDTIFEAGYFYQPHLTPSLKHFIAYTPAQIVRLSQTA